MGTAINPPSAPSCPSRKKLCACGGLRSHNAEYCQACRRRIDNRGPAYARSVISDNFSLWLLVNTGTHARAATLLSAVQDAKADPQCRTGFHLIATPGEEAGGYIYGYPDEPLERGERIVAVYQREGGPAGRWHVSPHVSAPERTHYFAERLAAWEGVLPA